VGSKYIEDAGIEDGANPGVFSARLRGENVKIWRKAGEIHCRHVDDWDSPIKHSNHVKLISFIQYIVLY